MLGWGSPCSELPESQRQEHLPYSSLDWTGVATNESLPTSPALITLSVLSLWVFSASSKGTPLC